MNTNGVDAEKNLLSLGVFSTSKTIFPRGIPHPVVPAGF